MTTRLLSGVVGAVVDLGRISMMFGKIERTGVLHADGSKETDTDHTVMLGLVACALAQEWNNGEWADTRISARLARLDIGLIAQFALVHDLCEVYAGDVDTLSITPEQYAAKQAREREAIDRLDREFDERLPWLPDRLYAYEEQEEPEARFVRAVDKILTRVVHVVHDGSGLKSLGVDYDTYYAATQVTQRSMERYAGEFTPLLSLGEELIELAGRTLR